MKKTHLIIIFLLLFTLAACMANDSMDVTPLPRSMKGYELYSWQDAEQWKFSLLEGTNREKAMEEIKAVDVTLTGLEELQSMLERIPSGEFVSWRLRDGLSFPSVAVIGQIERICKDNGLEFNITIED